MTKEQIYNLYRNIRTSYFLYKECKSDIHRVRCLKDIKRLRKEIRQQLEPIRKVG